MKRFLKLSALVLAVALVGAFVLNLSKPFKQITQKKVVNPDNLLNVENVKWAENISRNGITFHMNEDGSWHIFGTSTAGLTITLSLDPIHLEEGKQYMLSSGMQHDGLRSYYCGVYSSSTEVYVGDLSPLPGETEAEPALKKIFGAFTCNSSSTGYHVLFAIPFSGAVIDEVFYPCLVEGTTPGEFYVYE